MGSLMAGWDAKRVFIQKNVSMTKEEVENYWRNKRVIEEEHLIAALKAAARIKTQNLTDEDYRRFEDSLAEEENTEKMKKKEFHGEERIGIKDWWTKSNYAYLNQPPVKSVEEKPKSSYIAQFHIANVGKSNNAERSPFSGNAVRVF
ncbi:hypothetical protein SUGI_0310200 [Cryptomeria japonica]|uniref:uncharacterized protein LOC131075822 n=1 Tax=Cryptomeria japonica TaxID=3369 RepID=UPI002408A30C|nr:uncharacterized protein LOC131075822 [Cryptomeria japonica]GLJ17771.1 hypothetical protein SUGI_0310200 [Cryptomeria japonica]